MGLLFSCDKCTPSGTESVITFSDKLIDRLTFGGNFYVCLKTANLTKTNSQERP